MIRRYRSKYTHTGQDKWHREETVIKSRNEIRGVQI